jgi:hypothetical protein
MRGCGLKAPLWDVALASIGIGGAAAQSYP